MRNGAERDAAAIQLAQGSELADRFEATQCTLLTGALVSMGQLSRWPWKECEDFDVALECVCMCVLTVGWPRKSQPKSKIVIPANGAGIASIVLRASRRQSAEAALRALI